MAVKIWIVAVTPGESRKIERETSKMKKDEKEIKMRLKKEIRRR